MDLQNRTVWQQAAGDTNRNYVDLCLRWGVILNGPGSAGPWPECEAVLRRESLSSKKLTDLRRFAIDMHDGDWVVLRIGTATVVAVGQIVGGYSHREDFGDVDGWELQHVRRVRWLWAAPDSPQFFDTYALKQGDTTQKLNEEGVVMDWLRSLPVSAECFDKPLPSLPTQELHETSLQRVSEFLFDKGVASASIGRLLEEVGELTRIAKWYQRTSPPSEHETVAYLIVPLLRALGWTPQRMAVEWNYVDVALFDRLPRNDDSLRVVVEAKKMGNSCLSAKSQAMSYSTGKPECHRLLIRHH